MLTSQLRLSLTRVVREPPALGVGQALGRALALLCSLSGVKAFEDKRLPTSLLRQWQLKVVVYASFTDVHGCG